MKKHLIFACLLLTLLTGCQGTDAADPVTGNPANETPAEYRQRIESSSMPDEEKKRKLEELDRMQKMNEQYLNQGAPANTPPKR